MYSQNLWDLKARAILEIVLNASWRRRRLYHTVPCRIVVACWRITRAVRAQLLCRCCTVAVGTCDMLTQVTQAAIVKTHFKQVRFIVQSKYFLYFFASFSFEPGSLIIISPQFWRETRWNWVIREWLPSFFHNLVPLEDVVPDVSACAPLTENPRPGSCC